MILPDDTPESPTKSRAGPPSEVPSEEYAAPPPAYPGRSAPARPYDVEAHASSSGEPLLQPQHHVEQVEHAPQRFFKAFGLAVLIWIVVGSFARSAYSVSHPGRGHGHGGGDLPAILPRPTDGKVQQCIPAWTLIQPENAHIARSVSFQLPLSADVLYIFGRGSLSQGSITLESTSDHSLPRDTLQVDITIAYESPLSLNNVNFCRLERAPGEMGIGILTPERASVVGLLEIAINVRFPITPDGLQQVKAFETDLALFSHHLQRLQGKVRFESISLSSKHMPIHSDYLDADEAAMTTTNAKITGSYHATRALYLKTANSDLSTDVTLYHDDSSSSYSNITILNSNAAIDARLKLISTALSSTGGAFDVLAHTSNGRLDLRVPQQPLDSTLALDARTSNAFAAVHLAPAYEGAVVAETALARAEVECSPGAVDPAGRGRARVCKLPRASTHHVEGWTAWSEGGRTPHGTGNVRVASSNGAVKLSL